MRTFVNQAAQGDILLTRIQELPDAVSEVAPTQNGQHVVAHSETGHHHVVPCADVNYFNAANDGTIDPFVSYLQVNKATVITHLRGFDTHEPISISKGLYKINRQREHIAEGFRKAQD